MDWGQMEELMVTGRGNGAHSCKGMRQEDTRCVQGMAEAWEVRRLSRKAWGWGWEEKIDLQGPVFKDKELGFHFVCN